MLRSPDQFLGKFSLFLTRFLAINCLKLKFFLDPYMQVHEKHRYVNHLMNALHSCNEQSHQRYYDDNCHRKIVGFKFYAEDWKSYLEIVKPFHTFPSLPGEDCVQVQKDVGSCVITLKYREMFGRFK